MNLVYFTKEAYKQLKTDLKNVEEKYYQEDFWINDYFSSVGIDEYYRESSVVVPDISLVYSGDDNNSKNRDDFVNIRTLFDAWKDRLTPLQASDPMLWTALCHLKFKDDILKRWKKSDGEVNVILRFFATESRASLCYYNAISRLWWSGYLTYDEAKQSSNPYHLTEVLLSAQQIQKDLFDQSMSMNKIIVKGLLLALKEIQTETHEANTAVFRKCCDSYLNHYGAVTVLDSLSSDDIADIAFKYMKKNI